ncbi:T9SS type B sorting domain-containing protein [Daejeonella lutea]|uniref:Gliding motility-associated C-terminal domain-containing protein n=1 Tax=Daejeonella lutea TaxID=572036 RepID=A0A1T5C5P5_9SPHI|nr:gliding motility-associated C-terminal domain-containing protein [Daejeonella lutea]SKB54838.1 gliding motility-associated C-terminal domain-containing protein [Daejeonella lutea]
MIRKIVKLKWAYFQVALFFMLPVLVKAQAANEVHIFPTSPVYAHPNSNTNIFSNVYQGGTLVSYDTALINFYAQIWQNEAGSRLPDESARGIDGIGGIFRFSGQFLNPQRIITLGSQPYNGFPNLRLDNLLNVTAQAGNLHVNNNLDFVNGNLILSSVDVNVGHDGLGTITGYGNNNFIVTGTGFTGGSLMRSFTGTANTATDYPVGTSLNSYTPASLIYTGIPQNIKVRVADNVYNKMNFPEYVNKTWIVVRDFPDANGTLNLTLQHNSADEGIEYFRNRTEAYVTRYDAKLVGLYDIVAPHPTTTPGAISARAPVFGAYMNTRPSIGALATTEYFTKSVIKKQIDENTPVNIPDAISPNGDGLNDTYIIVKRLPTDKVRFEVYSRNQVLVYQNLDYDNTFDGNGNQKGFMGNVLPDGIYYYLISVNGAKGIPGYLIINR